VTASQTAHARVVHEVPFGHATLVVAAEPSTTGSSAWAAYLVRPLPSAWTWRAIVVLLTLATMLLFATAVRAMVALTRGAAELNASLVSLASDLSSPIPRPAVRELGDVADGIANLAQKLAHARAEEERLGRELSRQEHLAALGRVAAGVAHEVRNPLASIKLRLDLASASAPLPAPVDSAIMHASSEIARLDRLVADLLVVAGRAVGPKSAASIGALIRARTDGLSVWAKERDVTLETVGDATAIIDSDAIARALDNLLRNAVEASPPGGRVDVRARALENCVSICVEDRGPGIADGTRLLFEPFFTTKAEGTGLGLALSRAIARAHGGDVAYAREGKVTRFELTVGTEPPHVEAEAAE
jgi:signal transduction histidine kinase